MAGKYHHGNSPAAWTAVVIIIVGFCVGSAFTVMAQPLGVVAGGGIVALGLVVGMIMRAMGLGQEPAAPSRPATETVAAAVAEADDAPLARSATPAAAEATAG